MAGNQMNVAAALTTSGIDSFSILIGRGSAAYIAYTYHIDALCADKMYLLERNVIDE